MKNQAKNIIIKIRKKLEKIIILLKKVYLSFKIYGTKSTFRKIIDVLKKHNCTTKHIYEIWIKNNEPDYIELKAQKKYKFNYFPKISILVLMDSDHLNFIKELLESIMRQTYSNWEICFIDKNSKRNLKIEKLEKKDSRIKYIFLNSSKESNISEVFKKITGDFLTFVKCDDTIALFSLYEIVKCINENPDVKFIYTDEDQIDERGHRSEYYLKPDFSIDTLRAKNYIYNSFYLKSELIKQVENFGEILSNSHLYDLILRISELTGNIIHIPRILYHQRRKENSLSNESEKTIEENNANLNAIKNHLKRKGITGNINQTKILNAYEIEYDIIGNPKVSIIIPNKDMYTTLKECVDSILELTTYKNYEIIIVENNSTTNEIFDYYKKLEKNNHIKVVYYKEKGFNYSRLINFGVKNSTGDYIVQLNNDTTLLTPRWLEKMLGFAQREDVGAVGAKLYFPDMSIQHAGVIIGEAYGAMHSFITRRTGYNQEDSLIRNVSVVTGACQMSRKEIYEQVGYMNELFEVNYNDVDFCLKIRELNKLIVYNPFVEFIHYESKTRAQDYDRKKLAIEYDMLLNNWRDVMKKGDPYYNYNFRHSPHYSLNIEKQETQ